nr:MAG: hypothetical protein 2 [Leviviridae sp.]
MFANTLTLTYAGASKVLNRTNQDNGGSEYTLYESTQEFLLKIRHSKEKNSKDGRTYRRHNVLLEHVVYATPSSFEVKSTTSATFRHPADAATTYGSDLTKALSAWLNSGTVIVELAADVN